MAESTNETKRTQHKTIKKHIGGETMILEGYKTYISAGLAFAGAAYYILVEGNTEKGYELFIIGLGLAGLRNAISNK